MHAIAKAKTEGDTSLLETPSGKIKQDTFFERAIGLGKKLIAKMQGKSYKLEIRTFEEAKKIVQERLEQQLNFFNKKKHDEKGLTEGTSEIFIESLISTNDENFLKNPQCQFLKKLNSFSNADPDPDFGPEPDTLKNMIPIYSNSIDSNRFKIKSKLLEERYKSQSEKKNINNVSISEEDLNKIDDITFLAEELMENPGESMNGAIIIAKLMCRDELCDVNNKDLKYEIAKTFADRYLRRSAATKKTFNFSVQLSKVRKAVELRSISEECLNFLNSDDLGNENDRKNLSIVIAFMLQQKNELPFDSFEARKYIHDAETIARRWSTSDLEAELYKDDFNEELAWILQTRI